MFPHSIFSRPSWANGRRLAFIPARPRGSWSGFPHISVLLHASDPGLFALMLPSTRRNAKQPGNWFCASSMR
jgi:hypothetical protein